MRREQKLDIAIAVVAFATSVVMMFTLGLGSEKDEAREGDALGVALLALMNLPLVARRRHPRAVFGAALTATVAIHVLRYPGALGLWPALSVYSLAAYAPDAQAARRGGLFAGAAFAAMGTLALIWDPNPGIVAGAVGWAGAWVAGDVSRQRRESFAELRERAERAERESERERRLAAAEERTRIARELHDSAGHAINVILVQAGAARLLHERDPEGSKRALATIEDVARATIGEIDRLVRALRDDASVGGETAPLAGTVAIDELVQRHRDGGLEVTLRREGTACGLGTVVDRAAYRIVQEALTNAARYGDGQAEVVLRFDADGLDIRVTNPVTGGAPAEAATGGHGLVGMRERAALLGGTLDAGADNGAFRVRARLPYDDETAP